MQVTAAKYAEIRGRSKGWVSAQIDAGMPAAGAGRSGSEYQIDTGLAIQWEVDNAREKAEEKPGSQRDRLAKAQAEKFELENSRRRGELMLVEHAILIFNSLAADLAGRLDGLPGRIANEFAGITDPAIIRSRALEETRGIRSGVAEYLRKLVAGPAPGAGGDDSGSAAGKKPKRVGRRKKSAARRKRRAGPVEE